MVAKGVLVGTKPLPDVPDWMGGGDPANDGTSLAFDSNKPGSAGPVGPGPAAPDYYLLPSGLLAETIPRRLAVVNITGTLSSGVLVLQSIVLPAGAKIGHLVWWSNQTGAGTPSHWWFGLFDSNDNALAFTADQLTNSWSANTQKSLAIATTARGAETSFTTTYAGLHYLGVMVTASSVPSLWGVANLGNSNGPSSIDSPVVASQSTASLTTVPSFPFTAAALVSGVSSVYGTVKT